MLNNNFIMAIESLNDLSNFINGLPCTKRQLTENTKSYLGTTYYFYILEGVYTQEFVNAISPLLISTNGDTYYALLQDTTTGTSYTYGNMSNVCELEVDIINTVSYNFNYDLSTVTEAPDEDETTTSSTDNDDEDVLNQIDNEDFISNEDENNT